MNLWINEAAPKALEQIGWKCEHCRTGPFASECAHSETNTVFLVFIALMAFHLVLYYFYLPETANVPLEEMAKLFGDEADVAIFSEDIHLHEDPNKPTTTMIEHAAVPVDKKTYASIVRFSIVAITDTLRPSLQKGLGHHSMNDGPAGV